MVGSGVPGPEQTNWCDQNQCKQRLDCEKPFHCSQRGPALFVPSAATLILRPSSQAPTCFPSCPFRERLSRQAPDIRDMRGEEGTVFLRYFPTG